MEIFRIGADLTNIHTIQFPLDTEGYIVDQRNKYYTSINGILYQKLFDNELRLIRIAPKMSGTITLPDNVSQIVISDGVPISNCTKIVGSGVRIIDEFSFSNNLIEAICFPNVQRIKYQAFSGCRIKQLSILHNVAIDAQAFSHCKNMQRLDDTPIISNRHQIYDIHIYGSAFESCISLQTIKLTNAKKVTLGNFSFKNCVSLQSLTIKNINRIPAYAFQGCPNIKKIIIPKNCIVDEKAFEPLVKPNIEYIE